MLKLFNQSLRQQIRYIAGASAGRGAVATGGQEAPVSVESAVTQWREKLQAAGVGNVDFNLKCLVAHVLKQKFSKLPTYNNLRFTESQHAKFESLCEARSARMPLQYLLGEWEFMGLTLKTTPSVFIPRPETEEFVRLVIERYRDEPSVKMLEVGCGSGAISLALMHSLPQVQSTAIERSKAATKLAWENAALLGLQDRFKLHNHTMAKDNYMPEELKGETYDLIVSNPPYVKASEFPLLHPEVTVYENLNALDGGPDGLQVARLVFDLACVHLRSGGKMWLELGNEHPPLVKTIMNLQYKGRLRYISGYEDQYQRERFVEIEKV